LNGGPDACPGGPQCTWFLSPYPKPGRLQFGATVVVVGATVVVVAFTVVVVGATVVVVVAFTVVVVVGATVGVGATVVVDAWVVGVGRAGTPGESVAPCRRVVCPGVVGSARKLLTASSKPPHPGWPAGIAGMTNVSSATVVSPVPVLYAEPPVVEESRC